VNASRELMALRAWHAGSVACDTNHEFVGAWINGINGDSSGKVKHRGKQLLRAHQPTPPYHVVAIIVMKFYHIARSLYSKQAHLF
jgi:hypothetical protein